MDTEAFRLRSELARVEKGRGKRYPAELQARVVQWAKRRRSAGASWQQIKRELGQRFDTVRRWCQAPTTARDRALVPVRVVSEQTVVRTVSVVSPSGFRVDGLTLSEAAALLRDVG
jgi:hypothetical protein